MDDQPQRLEPHRGLWRNRTFPALLVCAILASIVIYWALHERTAAPPAPMDGEVRVPDGEPAKDLAVPLRPPESPSRNSRQNVARVPDPIAAAPRPPQSAALPAESAVSQGLIQRFSQLDPNQGQISAEQAIQLRQNFTDLVGQGTAAVPAIRQFLESNHDFSFEDTSGANAVGYASVRAGLFDVLRQIGGPEATGTFLSTLRNTADPSEIALLGRYLEEQAPGQYRQEVVAAARETLDHAARGQLPVRETAPLFQVLQRHGDASVVADLERVMPQWNYYATMALAGLPEGQGVATLVQRVQGTADGGRAPDAFVLQMLAQSASQHPDAAAALLEQARLNQIPDRAWVKIVEGLAGDQYQLGHPSTDVANAGFPAAGLKTYHIQSGNQNFYSLPFNLYGTLEEAAQRRVLVDQLLAATQNPAAVQALQNARAVLSAP